jgi:hypothetical protein
LIPALVITIAYPFFGAFSCYPGIPRDRILVRNSDGVCGRVRCSSGDRMVAPAAQSLLGDGLIPSTQWWTATTTCAWLRTSAIAFGRVDVAVVMLCYAVYLGEVAVNAAGVGPLYYAGLAVALSCAVPPGCSSSDATAPRFSPFLQQSLAGLSVCRCRVTAVRLSAWPRTLTMSIDATRGTAAARSSRDLLRCRDCRRFSRDVRVLILGSTGAALACRRPVLRASPQSFLAVGGRRRRCALPELPYRRRLVALRLTASVSGTRLNAANGQPGWRDSR